ncbi:hypothetical protein MMC25_007390 [Agyrium rufum]|nr:hypothetical protein [Agyrium rufum]
MSSSTTNQVSPLPAPQRVITTMNAEGKAVIKSTHVDPWTSFNPAASFNLLYTTSSLPVPVNNEADIKAYEKSRESANVGHYIPNGSVLRMVDTAPGNNGPPFMHRTKSLDYGFILFGSIELILDSGETKLLKQGDVIIQRGVMHAWRNPSETEWARVAFMQLESETLVFGGQEYPENFGRMSTEQVTTAMNKKIE